jgi:hypothetical protein
LPVGTPKKFGPAPRRFVNRRAPRSKQHNILICALRELATCNSRTANTETAQQVSPQCGLCRCAFHSARMRPSEPSLACARLAHPARLFASCRPGLLDLIALHCCMPLQEPRLPVFIARLGRRRHVLQAPRRTHQDIQPRMPVSLQNAAAMCPKGFPPPPASTCEVACPPPVRLPALPFIFTAPSPPLPFTPSPSGLPPPPPAPSTHRY